jgi:hypothetical protein
VSAAGVGGGSVAADELVPVGVGQPGGGALEDDAPDEAALDEAVLDEVVLGASVGQSGVVVGESLGVDGVVEPEVDGDFEADVDVGGGVGVCLGGVGVLSPPGRPGSTGGSGGLWCGRPCSVAGAVGRIGTVTPTCWA